MPVCTGISPMDILVLLQTVAIVLGDNVAEMGCVLDRWRQIKTALQTVLGQREAAHPVPLQLHPFAAMDCWNSQKHVIQGLPRVRLLLRPPVRSVIHTQSIVRPVMNLLPVVDTSIALEASPPAFPAQRKHLP